MASYYDNGVQLIDVSDPSNPVAVGSATDEVDGFTVLHGARAVATFTVGGKVYAIVASYDDDGQHDDGVQLIDVSDPSNPLAVGSATDEVDGFARLNGASGVAIFTVGTNVYAIVASHVDSGVQLIDVSDPSNPVAVSARGFTAGRRRWLSGACLGVRRRRFTVGGRVYAIVTGHQDDGV